MLEAVRQECIGIPELEAWVHSNLSAHCEHGTAWGLIIGAIGLVVITALVVAPMTLYLRPKGQMKLDLTRNSVRTGLLAPGDNI